MRLAASMLAGPITEPLFATGAPGLPSQGSVRGFVRVSLRAPFRAPLRVSVRALSIGLGLNGLRVGGLRA